MKQEVVKHACHLTVKIITWNSETSLCCLWIKICEPKQLFLFVKPHDGKVQIVTPTLSFNFQVLATCTMYCNFNFPLHCPFCNLSSGAAFKMPKEYD